MADKGDQWANSLSADSGGWVTGFLADEDKVDRRLLWRLGSWGVAAVGAVVVAIMANQLPSRHDQDAASDVLMRQVQQIQSIAGNAQIEARRLAHAIDTLNGDRDRLYSRVTSIEQNLDSVTGSIKRQGLDATAAGAAAVKVLEPKVAEPKLSEAKISESKAVEPKGVEPRPSDSKPSETKPSDTKASDTKASDARISDARLADLKTNDAKAAAIVALPSIPSVQVTAPAASVMPPAEIAAPKSLYISPVVSMAVAPPLAIPAPELTPSVEPVPSRTETTASIAVPTASELVATPVARTEFGVDIGGANSIEGLRAIWRSMSASRALAGLRPVMMVKERGNGLGMQLRLVAGPLTDAAAAAQICATLTGANRPCETSVFDGQRLALKTEASTAEKPPAPVRAAPRKRVAPKPIEHTELPAPKPIEEPAPPPKPQSPLSSLLGMR